MNSKLVTPLLLLLIACGSDGGFQPVSEDNFGAGSGSGGDAGNFTPGTSILGNQVTIPDTDPGTGVIYGKVLNADTGEGISGVTVSSGGISATTDADGAYMLVSVPYANRVIVNTDADGYARQSKIVVLSDVQHAVILNPPLQAVGTEVGFDPTAEQTIISGSASIVVPANGLGMVVDGSEQAATGTVTAKVTGVDASNDPYLMPGDYVTNTNAYIESFGALSMRFEDESGNELDLIGGATANISIPVASSISAPAASAGEYSYSRETGVWTNEGTMTLNGTVYEGQVSHFATWNADSEYTPVTISGCVDDGSGSPLAGVVVNARGADYIGTTSVVTDASGNFQLPVKGNSRVLISASIQGRLSNTLDESTGSGQTLSECIHLPPFSISVSLTWGANPSDLDTHLVAPNYHVYYASRGSLFSTPFAALDVDDVTGFGPEVLTITQFTEPGNYTYSVYRFAGTGTMADSPARVALNYNGETFVFAPPSGQGDNRTWNVFQIIVGNDLQVQDIIALQSWSAGAPQ
ncbi:MAG: hypothetical protein OQK04_00305 [Kangiellaceae bacterium]|nr:hypothetical protein [Kangiellaceae bacterium]MCW8997141.1 hypothetical protein [Kangiellaceae bacterium]